MQTLSSDFYFHFYLSRFSTMATPRKRTAQEQFDDQLENYIESNSGKEVFHAMFADFLRSPQGAELVREIVEHNEEESAQTLSTTATTSQDRVSPPKKPRHSQATGLNAKWKDVLTEATKKWRYQSIKTIRGRGPTMQITGTTKHVYREMDRHSRDALSLVNQARFTDEDERRYVLAFILDNMTRRMRCNMRFEAGVVIINALRARKTITSPEATGMETRVYGILVNNTRAQIPDNLQLDLDNLLA